MCGGDAALCKIALTTYFLFFIKNNKSPPCSRPKDLLGYFLFNLSLEYCAKEISAFYYAANSSQNYCYWFPLKDW